MAALASIGGAAAATDAPAEEPLAIHVTLPEWPQQTVRAGIEGALRRLSNTSCGALLSELRDESGRALVVRLRETGLTARQYLASLRFVDGSDEGRCHTDSITVAFTQPGSRVVYVCSQRFAASFPRNSLAADVSVLHEFLHSLGLGENPPSPGEISQLVQERCGRDR